MKYLTLFVLIIMLSTANADSTIYATCQLVNGVAFIQPSGGGFNDGYGFFVPMTDCTGFPVQINTTCSGNCSNCQISYRQVSPFEQTTPFVTCSSTTDGQTIINQLNYFYGIQQQRFELGLTYDWCGCSSGLSGGAIAGIVIGCVVGVALIGAAVWYFCVRKKSFDNYAAKE